MDLPFEAVEASRQETPTQVAFPSPAATADALIGARVGNFRVVRLLGRGGMGSVYLGEHEVIGSKVAIKVLHRHLAADQGLVDRFYAEARAANLIGHENVVSIFDIAHLPPNDHYLVMEFLEGDTLASVGARGLPTADAVPILMQGCDALGAAHARGVVHRDLKPENVFLVRRGQQQHFVKLVDFGIAKILSVASATMAGLMVGTPEFMAPEQWGGQEVDGRTDLYALGMIAYQLATGALPFVANDVFGYFRAHRELAPTPPRQLNPEVPRALEAAILKALAKDPADRFQTAAQFREALEAVLRPDVAAPAPAPIPTPISTPTPTPFPVRAEPLVPPPQPPPEPPPRRKGFAATLAWPDGTLAARLTELTRAGAYVPHDGAPPPLRTRLDVHFEGGGEAGSAEVVNHVNAAQA
ncbi:MAG: serine/threonine-protein kinase, partial [Myxococcales bacterium]